VNLLPAQAENGTVHVDVLATRELGVETRSKFQQRGYTAVGQHATGRRSEHAADDLQQGRFAGPVASNDADGFAPFHLNGYILERPEFAEVLFRVLPDQSLQAWGDKLREPVAWRIVDFVALAELFDTDRDVIRAFLQPCPSPRGERAIPEFRRH